MIQLANIFLNCLGIIFKVLLRQKKIVKKTNDLYINPIKLHVQCNIFHINKIKWEPDECSVSDFAINSYWWCLGYQFE